MFGSDNFRSFLGVGRKGVNCSGDFLVWIYIYFYRHIFILGVTFIYIVVMMRSLCRCVYPFYVVRVFLFCV